MSNYTASRAFLQITGKDSHGRLVVPGETLFKQKVAEMGGRVVSRTRHGCKHQCHYGATIHYVVSFPSAAANTAFGEWFSAEWRRQRAVVAQLPQSAYDAYSDETPFSGYSYALV